MYAHIYTAIFITVYVLLSVGSDHANYSVSWIDFGKSLFSERILCEYYFYYKYITL